MKDHPAQWIASGLTCREVAGRTSDYLDDQLPLLINVRVGLHLASCANCRTFVIQITLVSEAARSLPKPIPSPINRLHLRRHFAAVHSQRAGDCPDSLAFFDRDVCKRDGLHPTRMMDLRPGFPGGDYPLHGSILLRSMNAIIGFVARSIEEEPELMVSPDPRTRTVVRNPARTLEMEESDSKPGDYEFSVSFDGRYYSIRKFPVSQGMVPSWNQEAFAVLSNLFQMTVTDLTKYPTPAIAIAK